MEEQRDGLIYKPFNYFLIHICLTSISIISFKIILKYCYLLNYSHNSFLYILLCGDLSLKKNILLPHLSCFLESVVDGILKCDFLSL